MKIAFSARRMDFLSNYNADERAGRSIDLDVSRVVVDTSCFGASLSFPHVIITSGVVTRKTSKTLTLRCAFGEARREEEA